jgi:hypothetical protein
VGTRDVYASVLATAGEWDAVRYFFRGYPTALDLFGRTAAGPSGGGVCRLSFLDVLELVYHDSALGETRDDLQFSARCRHEATQGARVHVRLMLQVADTSVANTTVGMIVRGSGVAAAGGLSSAGADEGAEDGVDPGQSVTDRVKTGHP